MKPYTILFRYEGKNFRDFTQEDYKALYRKFNDWKAQMREKGELVGMDKLDDDHGVQIRKRDDEFLIADGPYIEANEIVGGFATILARDIAHATEVAKGCPLLAHGACVEVRETIDKSCD